MNTTIKVFCNYCNTKTNHDIKSDIDYSEIIPAEYLAGENKEDLEIGNYSYQTIECKGCGSISFRIEGFELVPNELGGKHFEVFYPPRYKDLLFAKRILGIPDHIDNIYNETIKSYNNNLYILCSAGLRALVESICKHFNCEKNYLHEKISELHYKRLIGKELSESLRVHKYFGDQALHNLESPSKKELLIAIDLIEHTLITLFSVSLKHQYLKESISKRLVD